MRKIKPAPETDFDALLNLMKSGLLEHVPSPLARGKYLHWHELIRRTPPAGLSHQQWWQALKFRRSESKPLPLLDARGRPFRYMVTEHMQEQLHRLDLQGGGRLALPEQVTNPETRARYYVSSLIEEAITSSQIEGAATTSQAAREMLRKGRPPRDMSERMIFNNYLTMRHIGEVRQQPLSPELVFELHRLVTQDTLENSEDAGALRRPGGKIYVTDADTENIYFPPPAEELPKRLEKLCAFANGAIPEHFIHPVIRAMILHFWLAYDHPFVDGNGRTARALFYWSMLHHGYWLFSYISISHVILRHRWRYDLAYLFSESDENDLTYFLDFHMEAVQKALEALEQYLAKKAEEVKQAEAELKASSGFNHRQKALLAHALRHPRAAYTVESHRRSHDVTYETARTDLRQLEEAGLLLRRKLGKAFIYSPHPRLQEILAVP